MLSLRSITTESVTLDQVPAVYRGTQRIISKTPFRISFFGGGTDYPAWYREHEGAVIGTTIDKYCYLTCRYLPPFFDHRTRIVYSKQECVNDNARIIHPPIRAALSLMEVHDGVEIHHDGDLPARSGLGSSSACTVGILNALYAMQGRRASKMEMTLKAIHIEQNLLGENVGSQDQAFAAHGGFNKILFHPTGQIEVLPVTVMSPRRYALQRNLMFCFTRTTRVASRVAKSVIENIPGRRLELEEMRRMVDVAEEILYEGNLDDFGRLLHESWALKRSISPHISNSYLDEIYHTARKAGALGGKLIGAGGGGFMVFYVPFEQQDRVKAALSDLVWVPLGFESEGSKIIYYSE